jgi:glyoxalase family protein
MIDRIVHRVGGESALDFWSGRLAGEGVEVVREPGRLRFADPEGMSHELAVDQTDDAALTARSNEVPEEFALRGFDSVHALVADPARSEALLGEVLGFTESAENLWQARGEHRGGRVAFAQSEQRGVPGAGTVHHIAWSVPRAEQEQWRERLIAAGAHPTPIIDRFYFESVYFREPSGILYELATLDGAGFAADEAQETLGERLALPPRFEPMREQIAPHLTPLPDTSRWRPAQ